MKFASESDLPLEIVAEFFADVSSALSDGLVLIDSHGKVLLWNNTIQNMTGISAANASGRYIWDIVKETWHYSDEREQMYEESRKFVLDTLNSNSETLHRRIKFPCLASNGRKIVLSINLFKKKFGKESLLCCVLADITDLFPEIDSKILFSESQSHEINMRTPEISPQEFLKEEALHISAEKYSRSFRFAPISLTITTLNEGKIIDVNDEFLRNTGYTREEIRSKTVFDINIWESPEVREQILSPVKKWKPVKNREIIFRHKDGSFHNYIFSAEPVRIGEVDCIVSNFIDVTETRKLEKALRVSEEKFSKSFMLAPISLSVTTLEEGVILEVNDEFLNNTGYKREEIVGKTVFDIKIWEPPEDRNRIIPILRQGGRVKNIEIVFRHKNGDLHNYIYSAEPIVLDGVACIISIFFDITEKKKLETALKISEEMYKTIFESSGSAMGIVHNDTLVLVNNGMVTLSGYSKKEMEGKMKWQDFVVPEYVREIRRMAKELATKEVSLINKSEFKLRDSNGNIKDVFCLTTLGPGENQYVVTLIDMTEYNNLLTQINEISKREQQRVGELLHDNLIQYLTGISLLVRTLEIKKQVGRSIELKDIKKIHDLVGESLTLAERLLKGLFLVEIDYEGLPSALKNLATSVNDIYDITCTFEDNGEFDIDVMSATELFYIANEAVHNSVKHGKSTEINIRLYESDCNFILEVSDNGIGIDEKRLKQSEGIGLKLMKFRAKMIGAKFSIKNKKDDKGVMVSCTFPKKN
jgi:PAS domain S-box-containing protein